MTLNALVVPVYPWQPVHSVTLTCAGCRRAATVPLHGAARRPVVVPAGWLLHGETAEGAAAIWCIECARARRSPRLLAIGPAKAGESSPEITQLANAAGGRGDVAP